MSLTALSVIIPEKTFNLFGLTVSMYGLIMSVAIITAVVICLITCKMRGVKPDDVIDIGFIVIPMGVIGARIVHVISRWDYYFNIKPMTELWGIPIPTVFAVWEGGITILGAISFGALGVLIASKIKKLNVFKVADFIAPAVALAQGIGRWGNFFNQELFGQPVNYDIFPFSVFINRSDSGVPVGNYMGLFFYESVLNLINFAICMILLKTVKKEGLTVAVFVLFYGITRVILEGLRMEYVSGLFGLHFWQWIALGFIAAGIAGVVIWIWYHYRRIPKDEKGGQKENVK